MTQSTVSFSVVIPARLASTRLPDKPLADIAGKPMVVRVAEQAAKSQAARVVVAADDQKIIDACTEHGVAAVLTSKNHASGTDRLAEAALLLGLTGEALVVNVQGDEPLLDPQLINDVAMQLADGDAPMATAAHTIHDAAEFFNPNVVKVVTDAAGRALYFSRAPIPWARDAFAADSNQLPPGLPALRHIGIYGYRADFLQRYATLTPSPLEQIEMLEQLRVLWHGYNIAVACVEQAPLPGVDTPEDLARACAHFANR